MKRKPSVASSYPLNECTPQQALNTLALNEYLYYRPPVSGERASILYEMPQTYSTEEKLLLADNFVYITTKK